MKLPIIKHLQKNGSITAAEAEQILDVSRATAARYFDELETDRKVEQVGKSGPSVHYRLIFSNDD